MSRPVRIAIAEANNFHEETIFALATAARQAVPAAELTVFAPDHWESRSFLLDDMGIAAHWRPFPELADRPVTGEADFDLLMVNTFPSPAGQPVIEENWFRARTVLGLAHDLDFFAAPSGADAALRRHPNLTICYPGPALPDVAGHLAREHQAGRVLRWMPMLRPHPQSADGLDGRLADRLGIALPGALEFARRDYALAFGYVARTRSLLRIFGRSHDSGDGPKKARDLDADRRQLWEAIDSWGITEQVATATDVTCREFYQTVSLSRWVAVLPNQQDYLRGKLTGAVTAAVSCGVPMLASPEAAEYYTRSDPELFAGCMLPFTADGELGQDADLGQADLGQADLGRDADLGHAFGQAAEADYRELCRRTLHTREALIRQNVDVVNRLLGR